MGLNLFRITLAKIWDNNGEVYKNIKIKRNKKTFQEGTRTYNIKTQQGSYYNDNKLLYDRRFYQYNIDCPDPIKMDKKMEPLINATDYNSMLETKHLQKLNDISKGSWLKNLDFKTILAVGAVIVVGYLMLTGQLI